MHMQYRAQTFKISFIQLFLQQARVGFGHFLVKPLNEAKLLNFNQFKLMALKLSSTDS